MKTLQVLRLSSELESCRDRLKVSEVSSVNNQMQADFKEIIFRLRDLIGAGQDIRSKLEISNDEAKAFVISVSEPFKRMVETGRQMIREIFVPSGMLASTGANSQVLHELVLEDPRAFGGEARRVAAMLVRNMDVLLQEPLSPAKSVLFFSPVQMESDLLGAFDKATAAANSFGQHNTNWLKVGLGVIRVAGGLVGKAAGALACATGAGCVAGGAAIVTGTANIIGGIQDIGEGLEEQ